MDYQQTLQMALELSRWKYKTIWTYTDQSLMIETNGIEVLFSYGHRGKYRWTDPAAVALAIGYIHYHQPIQPLLDWLIEHTANEGFRQCIEQAANDLIPKEIEGETADSVE